MMRTPDSLSMCSKPLICWQRFDQVDFGSRPWILPDPADQRDGADEETERFVAAIYADRRQAAEDSSPE